MIKCHLGGINSTEYKKGMILKIGLFAQDKAIYYVQFVTHDSQIAFGSTIQREACEFIRVDRSLVQVIWEDGGQESFRKGLSSKRKTIICSLKVAIRKRK